jgi:hypothetical protein
MACTIKVVRTALLLPVSISVICTPQIVGRLVPGQGGSGAGGRFPAANIPLNHRSISIVLVEVNAAEVRDTRRETMKYLPAAIGLAILIATSHVSRAEDITRFAPLKADELTQAQKAWADMIAAPPRNAKFVNPPYRAYIRNPDLAPRLSALSEYLRWNTSLPPRLSELAILITARQWTAQYEWFAHYPLALKGGLDPKVANDRGRQTPRQHEGRRGGAV